MLGLVGQAHRHYIARQTEAGGRPTQGHSEAVDKLPPKGCQLHAEKKSSAARSQNQEKASIRIKVDQFYKVYYTYDVTAVQTYI